MKNLKLRHVMPRTTKSTITRGKRGKNHNGLKPQNKKQRIVRERWSDFFNNKKRKWYATQDRIHAIRYMAPWIRSGELGRLLYNLKLRDNAHGFWRDNDDEFSVASFRISEKDDVWVCEADWLRKYHDGSIDTYEAHVKFAESRVGLSEYGNDFELPEYMIGNRIALNRIDWSDLPKRIKPKTFCTRPNSNVICLEY